MLVAIKWVVVCVDGAGVDVSLAVVTCVEDANVVRGASVELVLVARECDVVCVDGDGVGVTFIVVLVRVV